VVDLAMKLSPDSMLLSPRSDSRDEEILIHSSPELEMKKTPRVMNYFYYFIQAYYSPLFFFKQFFISSPKLHSSLEEG
jgi:hypothetical protein